MFLALLANRNIIAPISTTKDEEIRLRLEEGCVETLITLSGSGYGVEPVPNHGTHEFLDTLRDANRPGLILFSSGSTGKPKAMIHDLDRLLGVYESRKPRSMAILVFLMFDHIGGLNTLFNGLAMGAFLVLCQSRDAHEVASLVEKHKITLLPASPTLLNLLLMAEVAQSHDLSSLRMVTYGTEPMPESLLARIKKILPKARLIQTFGASETGIAQTFSKSSQSTLLRIDDPHTEFKIVSGELWLKSATQILGYLNHPGDNFTDDGWFRTGDLVEEAGDGFLRIVGRTREVINVGGQKVLPAEVESVLLEMEGVADCLVFGQSNVITGQMVVAEVTPAKDADAKALKKDIRRYCRERLDPYKVPSKVILQDSVAFSDRFKKIRRKDDAE
ncbi:MAG: long-chain fatty acid--CoA ligase [Desulfovibrio sp.]|nr:MAG: long-chain fatty acid--CoA ligase [Desulfovibrio sp.]